MNVFKFISVIMTAVSEFTKEICDALTTSASLTLLTPIWAAIIGGILISEWLSPFSVPGGIITLIGLWFIIKKNKLQKGLIDDYRFTITSERCLQKF